MKSKVLIFKAAPEEANSDESFEDPYKKYLKGLGFSVKIVNVIAFNFINQDILKMKLGRPNEYSAIVFGSPRSVKAVANAVESLHEGWKSVRAFAVGETTSRLAKSLLTLNCEGENTGSGEALAPVILKSDLKKTVLMPVGNLSRDTIANSLKSNGLSVDAVQVYETVPHPELRQIIENTSIEDFNVLVFFSPSGVNSSIPILCDLKVNLNEMKLVSIGPTTEKALLEIGLHVSASAAKPSPEGLAQAISSIVI